MRAFLSIMIFIAGEIGLYLLGGNGSYLHDQGLFLSGMGCFLAGSLYTLAEEEGGE